LNNLFLDDETLKLNKKIIHSHLGKMPVVANTLNDDLSRGFTVAQVSEKHGWTDPKVWILALEGKKDHDRFKALGWGFRTWDQWEWNDCDNRFGDDWPGRIPAQLTANMFIKKGSGWRSSMLTGGIFRIPRQSMKNTRAASS
jgi:hypothetical protein